jgi:hypothetical protein
MDWYDTNGNGSIDYSDNIDPAHMDMLNAECDFDMDGSVDICEYHLCIVNVENEWRLAACPEGYPMIWCDCPFVVMPDECPGEWNCEDIEMISADGIA